MLAEAAESVATPQIRNVGTLAGNVCQRPGAGITATASRACKNGGNHLLLGRPAKTSSTRSSAAGRATSCIRRTPRRRWSRSTRRSGSSGPAGERTRAGGRVLRAADGRMPRARTCWRTTRCSPSIALPAPRPGTRSTYHKVLDREAWTHAVVSAAVVLEMDSGVCRTRARRARRRRADSVAAAGGREDAGRPARDAGARRARPARRRSRRAAAGEERLQGADGAGDGVAHDHRDCDCA